MTGKLKQRVGVILAVTSIGVGCSDVVPVAPTDQDVSRATGVSLTRGVAALEKVGVLQRLRPLEQRHSATVVIGPDGGEIALDAAGFRMRIPPGALGEPIAISVTAFPGKAMGYDFGPHGLQFLAPVEIEQHLGGTSAEHSEAIRNLLHAGYYAGGTSSIDDDAGTAMISERMPARLSTDRAALTFDITHFSGYIIATGRSDTTVQK